MGWAVGGEAGRLRQYAAILHNNASEVQNRNICPQKKLVENVLIASQQNLLQACVAEWPPKPFTHPVFLIHSHIVFRDYGVGRSEETETLGYPGCFSPNRLTSEAPSHVKLVKIDFCSGDLEPGAWAPTAWEKYAKGNRHFLQPSGFLSDFEAPFLGANKHLYIIHFREKSPSIPINTK